MFPSPAPRRPHPKAPSSGPHITLAVRASPEGQELLVEKLDGEAGGSIEFDRVLLVARDDQAPVFGQPVIEGARVSAEILEATRAPKILVFKKQRRKSYRRKHGHRQDLTRVRITGIATG